MKRALSIYILAILSVGIAAAQTKKLSVKEFDKQVDAAFEATEKKVRRISKTFTYFKPPHTETGSNAHVYEFIPPDRFRSYGGLSGSQEKSWEYIEANDTCFFKGKDGEWGYFVRGGDMLPPYLYWWVIKAGQKTKIKSSEIRKEILNGQIVQKYLREARRTFTYSKGDPPPPPVVILQEIWISLEGLVLRAESIVYDGNTGDIMDKSVLLWEYDPKDIKIEAPKIQYNLN